MKTDGHVTIEKTAKKYKLALLVSGLCFFFGIFWLIFAVAAAQADNTTPHIVMPWLFIIMSVIAYIVTKLVIWWNHG